jgi:Fe-S-cluster containining protein
LRRKVKEANALTNTGDSNTIGRLMNASDSNQLCLECGLCCNGVIFAHGQLQPEDDAARLQSLGLELVKTRNPESETRKFHQPCRAFDGCRCKIYADRPKYCREFECVLLKDVQANRLETGAALRIIRDARRREEKVKRLLRELGDADEHVALSVRFRRMKRRMESSELDEENADRFGELTLAVHDLNVLLSGAFYPGS